MRLKGMRGGTLIALLSVFVLVLAACPDDNDIVPDGATGVDRLAQDENDALDRLIDERSGHLELAEVRRVEPDRR
jgi:hypothetical protein